MNIIVLAYDDGKVCYRDTGDEYSIPPKITFRKHYSLCFLFSLPLIIVHGQKNQNSIYFYCSLLVDPIT
jgi:hypothetical protein